MLDVMCDSREKVWGIKGQAVDGGSRAGMPEILLYRRSNHYIV